MDVSEESAASNFKVKDWLTLLPWKTQSARVFHTLVTSYQTTQRQNIPEDRNLCDSSHSASQWITQWAHAPVEATRQDTAVKNRCPAACMYVVKQVTAWFPLCNGQSCESRMVPTWHWQLSAARVNRAATSLRNALSYRNSAEPIQLSDYTTGWTTGKSWFDSWQLQAVAGVE